MSARNSPSPFRFSIEQVRASDRQGIRSAFDALYEQRYAHASPEEPVELVNVRLAAIGQRPQLHFPRLEPAAPPRPETHRPVYLTGKDPVQCPIYRRPALGAGQRSPDRRSCRSTARPPSCSPATA